MSFNSSYTTTQSKRSTKSTKFSKETSTSMLGDIIGTREKIKTFLAPSLEKTLDEELDEIRKNYFKIKNERKQKEENDAINNIQFQTFSTESPFVYSSTYKFFSEDYKYGLLADIRDSSTYRVEKNEMLMETLYSSLNLLHGANRANFKGKNFSSKKKLTFETATSK
jgi:hypothetical protein